MKFLAIFILLLTAGRAFAFNVCNSFYDRQYLAVAYHDQTTFVSQGWFPIEARSCQDFNFPNPSGVYYIYFENRANMKSIGQYSFCVARPGPFLSRNANQNAVRRLCTFENFAQVNLPGAATLWLGQPFNPGNGNPPQPPKNDELEWVGEIYYEGGLIRRGQVVLDGVYAASKVVLDVSACNANLNVLRVEALENGQYVRANAVGTNSNEYFFSRSVAIQELLVSVNGPKTGELIPCYIPVLIPKGQTQTVIAEDVE